MVSMKFCPRKKSGYIREELTPHLDIFISDEARPGCASITSIDRQQA